MCGANFLRFFEFRLTSSGGRFCKQYEDVKGFLLPCCYLTLGVKDKHTSKGSYLTSFIITAFYTIVSVTTYETNNMNK